MPSENIGNKITSIRICKDKVVVRFKDFKLDIPHDVFTSFYLFKGKVLTPHELKDINAQIENYSLYTYARRICSKSIYTEHKVREKLYLKQANKSQVDEVINKLKKSGLINDDLFVQEYIEYANNKNYGKNKINLKLKEKGVFPELINKIDYPYKKELDKANNWINKLDKKYDKYNYSSKKEHVIHFLIGEGFDLEIAKEVSNYISAPNEKIEKQKLNIDYQKIKDRYSRKYKGNELKQKVIEALLRKGYRLNEILKIVEG